MAETGSQQLFDCGSGRWRRAPRPGCADRSGRPSSRAGMDPQSFWRPFMDQGMAAWSKVMTQGPPSADLMGAVEAVPRSVDRRVVQGARAGHGHRDTSPRPWASRWRASSTRRGRSRRRPSSRSTPGSPGSASRRAARSSAGRRVAQLEEKIDGSRIAMDAVLRKSCRERGRRREGSARMIGITIDAIAVGDSAQITRRVTDGDIAASWTSVGDLQSRALGPRVRGVHAFKEPIAPGIWTAGLISAVIGTRLPGPGRDLSLAGSEVPSRR